MNKVNVRKRTFLRYTFATIRAIVSLSTKHERINSSCHLQPRELLPDLFYHIANLAATDPFVTTSAYLIVTNLDNQPQNASMLRLVHQLRRWGKWCMCCQWGSKGNHR